MKTHTDEFYIGYLPKAPKSFARAIRLVILALCVVVPLIAFLLAANERDFAASTFEFGQTSELTGTIRYQPVPMLVVDHGVNAAGEAELQSIPLIGFGKAGPEKTLKAMQEQQGTPLDGKSVQLRGTLIYFDGKTFLELTQGAASLLAITDESSAVAYQPKERGEIALYGEIVDPKCYFGVMKPGEGKPHRSCAARCIAGGIPPVFKASDRDGALRYFLILGADGSKINQQILPFVGQYIRVDGTVTTWGDWEVIELSDKTKINPLLSLSNMTVPRCGSD